MPLAAAFRRRAYCLGLGPLGQYAGMFGSFQIWYAVIGNRGSPGFCDQKLPFGP